jgi:Sec-independent protein translocase protein TatA
LSHGVVYFLSHTHSYSLPTHSQFTVLLVGYFVLGPSDLYKLVKEIGKFVQNIRSLGTDLTTTFENNLESQLQLEDIRKAQRELNDAFSFRRSINTQADEEAFTTTVTTPREPTVQDEIAASVTVSEATASAVEGGAPKRKIRRRVKKKAPPLTSDSTGVIPDLEMPLSTTTDSDATVNKYANRPTDPFITTYTPEEEAIIDQEFDAYTSMADGPAGLSTASSSNNSSSSLFNETMSAVDPAADASAQSRFQEQLSGNWNDQILANQDKLAPLAKVMEMLAVLEDEKIASTKRLEEEFRRRAELDEGYYQKQRKLLEEAASQVQTEASK